MNRNWRAVRCTIALAVTAALSGFGSMVVVGNAPAGADGAGIEFNGSAVADALLIGFIDPAAPVAYRGEVVAASPASAQAALDSLGNSEAYASLPYPGSTVIGAPGTGAGLIFGPDTPPMPNYPFYVSSSYPVKPKEEQASPTGGYTLKASSEPLVSRAEATGGMAEPAIAKLNAVSTVTHAGDGGVVAEAQSATTAISFGDALSISKVASRARAAAAPNQAAVLESSLDIGTVTVFGTEFGLSEKGLVAGPSTTPVPGAPEAALQALSANGLKLSYQPASKTENSITSAAVRIDYRVDVPGHGPVDTALTVGRVSSWADVRVPPPLGDPSVYVDPADGGDSPSPTVPGPSDGPTGVPAGSGAVTPLRPGDSFSTAAPDGTALGLEGEAQPSAAATGGPGPVVESQKRSGELAQGFRPAGNAYGTGKSLYLVLVLAGLTAVAGSQLIRRFTVQRP